ncbi:MAG TPA: adenylate/guanylate cyclase domain-containing protein [Nocardioidaceae bacterium]|nr:adenylate/guanylate cyclase domain-containing protein [Nocardioidaceae bacterium]
MVGCPSCGSAENLAGQRFCDECGAQLTKTCPACGSQVREGKRFCGQCGQVLNDVAAEQVHLPPDGVAGSGSPTVEDDARLPVASGSELRWVSVVFVDLVGFTGWSESRDPEDVRELLSGYFEVARTVIGRYGGVVEKFIGDAVMAVWGAPVAQEDDAERAVRAGLELVSAVAEFGRRRGLQRLQARAGVVTGQVASWANPGEGLVTGDRVNTAARVQSVAPPGTVLVDDATRAASRAAIAYVPAGEHTVKGKTEPLVLWQATRVVANVGGVQRVDGLEAGFVGRARELALVKEWFHASTEGSRARLVLVSGAAGVGKSRLGWEFEKYVDGLAATVWWHRGRCLSYGDGVAFWALAEMVRQRFGIAEEDGAEVAAAKLARRLPEWVPDPEERAFVTPRLGVLVGAADVDLGRDELFAGWRLFLERLAGAAPVAWVIEDLHWADKGLLDFCEYLLDWSADFPIFVLGFARPELAEQRPGWLADRRNAATIALDPLPDRALGDLLDDLVPGMPATAKNRICAQAEGIPLYAVETIRSLVDRDVVVPQGGVYRMVGNLGRLTVPATLTSLLAARLDGLPPAERELVKSLAVLGGTFPREAVSAVTDLPGEQVDQLLRSLVRKEVLTVRADPLSPERGQYGFIQTMLRTVVHDTLTKRERKSRHLAVAEHLRRTFPDDGDEVSEVIASHYHDAYTAAPDDPDAGHILDSAISTFSRAGKRAATVGSPDTAERQYRTAAELTDDETERAMYLEQAADMASQAGRHGDALTLYEAAAFTHAAAGRGQDAARLEARVGGCLRRLGRAEEGVDRMRAAIAELHPRGNEHVLADLHAELGIAFGAFLNRSDDAATHVEQALVLAAAHDLPRVLANALNGKALLLASWNRVFEAIGLLTISVDIAREQGLTKEESINRLNLGDLRSNRDLPGAASEFEAALVLARRAGDADGQAFSLHNLAVTHLLAGRWDEAERSALAAVGALPDGPAQALMRWPLVVLNAQRGQHERARHSLIAMETLSDSDDFQARAAVGIGRAAVAKGTGAPDGALSKAEETACLSMGLLTEGFRFGWPLALDLALSADRLDDAARLLMLVADEPPGHVPPYLRAQLARYTALIHAARDDHDTVEADLHRAITIFADLDYAYWLARTKADLAHWLTVRGRHDEAEPLLTEAVDTFTRLSAQPDLDTARSSLVDAGVGAEHDSGRRPGEGVTRDGIECHGGSR